MNACNEAAKALVCRRGTKSALEIVAATLAVSRARRDVFIEMVLRDRRTRRKRVSLERVKRRQDTASLPHIPALPRITTSEPPNFLAPSIPTHRNHALRRLCSRHVRSPQAQKRQLRLQDYEIQGQKEEKEAAKPHESRTLARCTHQRRRR